MSEYMDELMSCVVCKRDDIPRRDLYWNTSGSYTEFCQKCKKEMTIVENTNTNKKIKVKKPKIPIEFIIVDEFPEEYVAPKIEDIADALRDEIGAKFYDDHTNRLDIIHRKIRGFAGFPKNKSFDITMMSKLPEQLVNYCFLFLSTPETTVTKPKWRPYCKGCHELANCHECVENRKQWNAFNNRPAAWWKQLYEMETVYLWKTKYVPVLTERFKRMSNAYIKQLTMGITTGTTTGMSERLKLSMLWFQNNNHKKQSKKDWITDILSHAPHNGYMRKLCLRVIMLSKGMKPEIKHLSW